MISREELGAWLWGAADILRGAVSADDYSEYILPLLFYKRLSDVYSFEYEKQFARFGDDQIARDSMFFRVKIPSGCTWEDVRNTSINIGSKLNDVFNQIARANPKLERVINRTDFNNPNAIPEERIIRLIEHFSQKGLSNDNVSPDILGDGYEYLLKKFNEVAPTRAGEFYTPRELVKVLVGCLKPDEGMEIYDPCCGSGGMLIECYYYLKNTGKDPKKISLYGQEINDDTWAIAKMNEILHDLEATIVQGDTFINPKFLDSNGLKQFDMVIANPMWNQKGFKLYMEDDPYGRFRYGVANNSSADWGWIQHMLASLKETGRLGVVLDQGALFRSGAEGRIRRAILRDDLVECVVALPEKLFYNTGAPGCLIFLNRNKSEERRGKVLFVYAAESFEKLSNMNQLRGEDIHRIVEVFDGFSNVDKYSQVAKQDEMKENDWNLSVTRYVDIFDPPESVNIQKTWNQLKELESQRQERENKLAQYLKELGYEK
ncbi:SAM-dependent DNA methyltransferase [bacterium]|nr:SAM-dependent DNA methyltransferase [bacterium]